MSFTMGLTALVIALATLGCAPIAGGTTNLTGSFDSLSFSEANTTNNYSSSANFNPLGMGHLYYVTNYFIDLVVKKDLFPEGSKKHVESLIQNAVGPPVKKFYHSHHRYIDDEQFNLDWLHLQPLLSYHAGTLAVISVGLLFALVMPLAGLILCCCRCCRSSRRPRTEKHRDGCRRLLYGALLAAVATIILFGVVCAFVTNAYMENGIKALPKKLNTALDDSQLYFTNTKLEVRTLLVTNYNELQQTINKSLDSCGKVLTTALAEESQAVVLSNLTALVNDLPIVEQELLKTQTLTKELQNNADKLQNDLSQIRADLEQMLTNCSRHKDDCEHALSSKNVQNLNTTADFKNLLDRYFPKLPNMTESLDTVTELLNGNFVANVKKGKESLYSIANSIDEAVNKSKPDIEKTMKDAGDAIEEKAEKIVDMVDKLTKDINENVKNPIKYNLQKGIDDYSRYRYYIDISVSSVVLVVLLCMTLGLFYGFCGKRPDSMFNEDCCNKGTGASFLKLAVWVMFLFSTVLMLVTLAHFVIGVILQRAGCDTLRNPEDSQVFALIDKHVDVASIFPSNSSNITVSSIVMSCHMNESLFGVLQVLDAVNITEISEKFQIEDKILALKDSIKISGTPIVILDTETKDELNQLKNSPLNFINFTAFSSMLGEQIVAANVTELAQTLNYTAGNLSTSTNSGNTKNIQDLLRKHSAKLVDLQTTLINTMSAQVKDLIDTTASLQEHLKFNHSSLSDAIDSLLLEIEAAQKYLNTNATYKMDELTDSLLHEFVNYVHIYEKRVVNDLGRCGPVSKAYNATIVATCDEILKPFNGFWASIGWCLLLFIPAIIISLKLTSLYHKLDPYQGPLAESEYLYDAYADRDNIPLANGPDKKNHHRRYNETYDNSSGYMGDYNAHLGRGDRSRDRTSAGYSPEDLRFTDMAPKHWDFSNGGVPRYHSPPLSTEYERPPPYYYPGPGDSSRR